MMWTMDDIYSKASQNTYLRTQYHAYEQECIADGVEPMSFKGWVEYNS